MSLLTHAYLLERFGPLLNTEQLANVLHYETGSLRNAISRGEIRITTIRRGKTPLYAAEDVAAFIDQIRAAA